MRQALSYGMSVLLLSVAVPAAADWGGYAVYPGSYDWAYSAGWDSKSNARQRALSHCSKNAGGGKRCKVVLLTRKCGGLARGQSQGKPQFYAAEASSRDTAAKQALAQCSSALGASCEIRHRFCANDL